MVDVQQATFDYAGSSYEVIITATAGKSINIAGLSITNNDSTYDQQCFLMWSVTGDILYGSDVASLYLRTKQSWGLQVTDETTATPYWTSNPGEALWIVNTFAVRVSGIIWYYLT